MKKLAGAVWDYLVKAFEKASEVIKKAWEWVKTFLASRIMVSLKRRQI